MRQWQNGLSIFVVALLGLGGYGLLTPCCHADETAPAAGFHFQNRDDGALELKEGEKPVLVYNFGIRRKEGVPANRFRSTYIHPLYGLDGEILTDDFPVDHYHHRGLFWAWPHIRIDEKQYDLWMLHGIRQQFENWTQQQAHKEEAILGVHNGWYVGDTKVVDEQVRLHVGTAKEDIRVVDVQFQWTATTRPVVLWGAEGKSYGGISLRFAPRQNTVITTPLGQGSTDLNLTPLAWGDLTANFPNAPRSSGAAILVHPSLPDFPPMWITRHYGFLGVGWPGVAPVTFEPGKPVSCRCRVLIHRGQLDADYLHKAFETYRVEPKS